MIYYDLDGVLRDIHKACRYAPYSWNELCRHGMTIYEYITLHPEVLAEAEPTEYYPLVKDKPVTVLTHSSFIWIPYTRLWMEKYLPKATIKYCQHPLEKLDYLKEADFLVEDYPKFPDNSKIIMVDKPYNRGVNCFKRVATPEELEMFIKNVHHRTDEALSAGTPEKAQRE